MMFEKLLEAIDPEIFQPMPDDELRSHLEKALNKTISEEDFVFVRFVMDFMAMRYDLNETLYGFFNDYQDKFRKLDTYSGSMAKSMDDVVLRFDSAMTPLAGKMINTVLSEVLGISATDLDNAGIPVDVNLY